jgi:hypothetical protein
MWKIRRSFSKRMQAKHIEAYALQFVDKPMFLERVSEDISGDSAEKSALPSQDIQSHSSLSEPSF